MKDSCILLLSYSEEPFCTERVAGALDALGVEALRIDTDAFPSTLELSASLVPDQPAQLLYHGTELAVRAVWLWRIWPARLNTSLAPQHAVAAQRESATAMYGFLDLLGKVPFIDPPDVNQAASNKTRQLRLAQELGLTIPPTLITSSPEAARRFYATHAGNVIAKLQTTLTYGMNASGNLPTRLLRSTDLTALDGLRHCPMILQRYVPKAYELRIAWVDGLAFVGALDGKKCGVDWRYESTADWEPHVLPPAVHAALDRLMTALGLRQGAIDIIVTPSGEYVFLEVNPNGEWGMLERDLDLPIAAALARALTNPIPRYSL